MLKVQKLTPRHGTSIRAHQRQPDNENSILVVSSSGGTNLKGHELRLTTAFSNYTRFAQHVENKAAATEQVALHK